MTSNNMLKLYQISNAKTFWGPDESIKGVLELQGGKNVLEGPFEKVIVVNK